MSMKGLCVQETPAGQTRPRTLGVFLDADWGSRARSHEAAHLYHDLLTPAERGGRTLDLVAWGSVPVPAGLRMTPAGIAYDAEHTEEVLTAALDSPAAAATPAPAEADEPVTASLSPGAGGLVRRPGAPPLGSGRDRPGKPAPASIALAAAVPKGLAPPPAAAPYVVGRWRSDFIVYDPVGPTVHQVSPGRGGHCTCGGACCEHWGLVYAATAQSDHQPQLHQGPTDQTCTACGGPLIALHAADFGYSVTWCATCHQAGALCHQVDGRTHKGRTNSVDPLYRSRGARNHRGGRP